jgi:hypothetical protein
MRTVLRALLEERNWTGYARFRAKFEAAAEQLGGLEQDPKLKGMSLSESTYERWCGRKNKTTPTPDARRVLEHLFGRSTEELLSEAAEGRVPHRRHQTVSSGWSASPRVESGPAVYEMERQAAMAAQRALRFAVTAETNQVGPETMAHLSEEVRRLATAYPSVPLNSIFYEMIEAQDLIFRLLESNRVKPAQASELHLMAAVASGMLAKASHDMGDSGSAMRQARAAYVCADQAGHAAMRAWVRGLQSLIAYWAGRPGDSLRYATSGGDGAPGTGTVGIWLSSLEARAHALLGDVEGVNQANAAALSARENLTADDLDGIGGILTFPRPRQLYYAAEAEVLTGDGSASVEQHAEEAVRAYHEAPAEEWAFGDQAGAQTNLALARLASGNVEGAAEAVRPVLDLPAEQHIGGIVLSAQRVHRALSNEPVRSAAAATTLREELEVFSSTPVRALTS